jgi:hypothetical protein
VARTLLLLAANCLGESRRGWALAMQGELEAASEGGRPLAFAVGCVIAAWREMPLHAEGRFVLANNALALGLLVPIAGLQFASAAGLSSPFSGGGGIYGGPVPGSVQSLYLCDAFLGAVPSLLGLSLFLCLLQLRFAWLLLEGDWLRAAGTGSMIAAATATLVIFTGVLFLDGQVAVLQAEALAIDIAAAFASAWWHGRIFPAFRPEKPGR